MGACHDLAIRAGCKGTGETTLLRRMYASLKPGDVILADALFDNYFLASELRDRGIDLVARVKHPRAGESDGRMQIGGSILVWQRPGKPRGMKGEKHRSYPETLLMREVAVDARDKNNRVEQFKVITTILDQSVDGKQLGDLYERRWSGEVDIRSIKSTMQMDILRCKTPEMVEKEIWTHLLAYNLLRTIMEVAAKEIGLEPRQVSFNGTKHFLTAFSPMIVSARTKDRTALIDAMLTSVAYNRVGERPDAGNHGFGNAPAKPATRLTQPRAIAKLCKNRAKWF